MANTIVTFNEVIELNHMLEEKGISYKVHLHDRCGSQSFTLEPLNATEQPVDSVKDVIIEYFKSKRMTLSFTEDNHDFRVVS